MIHSAFVPADQVPPVGVYQGPSGEWAWLPPIRTGVGDCYLTSLFTDSEKGAWWRFGVVDVDTDTYLVYSGPFPIRSDVLETVLPQLVVAARQPLFEVST